jgi:hypothetical protein
MTLDPTELPANLDWLESIEKATLRLVVQGICSFAGEAADIFSNERDDVQDIAEDITREAMDRIGTSVIPVRLFGTMDYKRARYLFLPDFALRQALFVDSKAEKVAGTRTVTIQTSQTSMRIRQIRAGVEVDEGGAVPNVYRDLDGVAYLTTTVFVKYNYEEIAERQNQLESMSITCLPNGMLQDRYNPNAATTFWMAGRNAPTRGEDFRVRIGLPRLKALANWRVQHIQLEPDVAFSWDD